MALNMNPEIRAQWCAALRSGDYKQGREALRRLPEEIQSARPAYCCLGVLTDLWLKAGHDEMVPDEYADADPDDPPMISVWANVEGCLSRAVVEWAGLDSTDPELKPGLHGNAVMVNDLGTTFARIADLIDHDGEA
jgi:hypothetical protein